MSNRQWIVDWVETHPGCKATELAVDFALMAYQKHGDSLGDELGDELIETLNDLVRGGELVEVEYILPTMTYRVKSLYFPKGTQVRQVVPNASNV